MSNRQVLSSRIFNTDRLVLRVESSALNILGTITFCVTFELQHDGPGDDDSELSDETDSDESEADQNPATNQTNRQEDEESLNSADDVSGTDATEIFETGSEFSLFIGFQNSHQKSYLYQD